MKYIFSLIILSAVFTCHTMAQETRVIRGANISCNSENLIKESDIKQRKKWKVPFIRINFDRDILNDPFANRPTSENIWTPYEENIGKLDKLLKLFKKYNIRTIVSLDQLWGDDHNSSTLWKNNGNNEYLNHRIALNKAMAIWLKKKHKEVQYLEVWNEPHPYDALYKDYFLPKVVKEVRSINSHIALILMPPGDRGSLWYFDGWNGVSGNNILYSTHIYAPWLYTHQGIYGNPRLSTGWPASYKNFSTDPTSTFIDINVARSYIAQITDFQKRTGKQVIVTEFGVLRWAKDNDKYLRDLITVLEEQHIGWIFHSIAGWNGWNPTYNATDKENNIPLGGRITPAFTLLKSYWGKKD